MSLTLHQMRNFEMWRAELGDPQLIGHVAERFYNIDIRAAFDHYTATLTQRVNALEFTPAPSYWPEEQSVYVTGVVNGHARWSGESALELDLAFTRDAITVDTVNGLGELLLRFRTDLDDRVNAEGVAKSAYRLESPIRVAIGGLLQGEGVLDADHQIQIDVSASSDFQAQLNRTVAVDVASTLDHTQRDLPTGAYWHTDEDDSSARHDGALLQLQYGLERSAQLYLGSHTGDHWVRSCHGERGGWERLLTSANLNTQELARRREGLSSVAVTNDFSQASPSVVSAWNHNTLQRPTTGTAGVYMEIHSADGNAEPAQGNRIHRFAVAADGTLSLHNSINGAAFDERRVWTDHEFDPTAKADINSPTFNRSIAVAAVDQSVSQPVMHVGWQAAQPLWQMRLETTGDLLLNARDIATGDTQPLMSWSARMTGGSNRVNVHVNRVMIGAAERTAVYGFNIDSWGMYSTPTVLGWGNGDRIVTSVNKDTWQLLHDGRITALDGVAGDRLSAGWDAGMKGGISCDNWFRSAGNSGWMNSTYAGGWHMTDFRHIRSLNDKRVISAGYAVSFNAVDRLSITPLEFNGFFKPVTFRKVNDDYLDYGLDIEDVAAKYPNLIEDHGNYQAMNVNGVVVALVAQINHLAKNNQRLERQVMRLLAALDMDPDDE